MYKIFNIIILLLICNHIGYGKKNVLILLADDGGFEMRAYNNKICQTPHLDALAKQSLIFNNAYASDSSCSPSRAAILTGRPSHQNGMYGLHHKANHFDCFERLKTLPKILNENGLFTGIIGKKHVGPKDTFKFHYEQTEENNDILQVGRNITKIKLLVREFLQLSKSKPFFLYVGFHDPHRCTHTHPEYGPFCEKFGCGDEGMGRIPDWDPIWYQHDDITVPYFVPDTEAAKKDISAQYTAISRLDAGIGLVLRELENSKVLEDTMVIYTSDNGVPFPTGRTNLYDPGIAVPMFLKVPEASRTNQVTYEISSHLDIVPTILDWLNITDNELTKMTGKSLVPLTREEPKQRKTVFASHTMHEVTMYYPMRAVRNERYKLIHNINYQAPFPIDQDLYISPTFQDLMERISSRLPYKWNTNLKNYYFRDEWQLFDLKFDPEELNNIVGKKSMSSIVWKLKKELDTWLNITQDPWICAPHAVLENTGNFKNRPKCLPLFNEPNFLTETKKKTSGK